jgi:hypothetical protein
VTVDRSDENGIVWCGDYVQAHRRAAPDLARFDTPR